MSVIIRLQNLPWTANARDIRNFFTGLSIPEGGVHIIGGEMGDAFIAFSTDEDARCAMLKDREKLMEIQVRLLLSSRAEMQKVIETARVASTAAAAAAVATPTSVTEPRPPTVVAPAVAMPPVPQPPIIGGLSGFLLDPQQQQALAKQQIVPPVATTPSFLAYQQQAGITLADVGSVGLGHKAATLDRHSPEQGHFSSRRRQSRSRSLSRSSSSDDSDRSRDRDPRYHSRKRRPDVRSDSSERELKLKPQPVAAPVANNIMPWAAGVVPGVAPAAAPPAMVPLPGLGNVPGLQQQLSFMSVLPPVLQSYSTTTNTSTTTTNNYNLNTAVPPQQQQPLQPQYPVIPDVGVVVNKQVTQKQQQEPIAFANVNPYAQIYPQLFQQQQQLLLQQQTAKTASGLANSPGSGSGGGSGAATTAGGVGAAAGSIAAGGVGANSLSGGAPIAETCYIKISGMCPTTSYSDLRKYFAGLYIPHNGIKIINGANGVRTGIAYIEFSRVSSAQKALSRNNTMFRDRLVQIAPVGDEEFEQAEELVQRSAAEHSHSRGGGRAGGGGNGGGGVDDRSTSGAGSAALSASAAVDVPPTCVLFVEDLPQLTTEQDIMKMFSELYTVVDILLTPSPKNRRESVAYVLFARENEARAALDDTARHYIGFRKLRVHASNQLVMQSARDKMRRASEQLLKEEQQQREDAEREALQQQLQQQQQQQQLQLQLQQQQELLAKQNSDPRRRNNDPMQQQQQQQLQQHINNSNNNNNNLLPFGNPGMHNGNNNMPFAFQQQQQQQNNNNMGMHNNNNNNNMGPFGMPHNNNSNNQQMQHPHQGNPQRREDVFVRVHNCEYGTRVNDLGELFVSEQLRIEHIEMLFNERNQSAGEFIVEFCDTQSAEMAMRLFHNRRFRGRGLRIVPITPQEIADRMKKPFMDYLPRTNAARPGVDADADAQPPQQQQQQQQSQQQQQQQQQSSRRRGPSRFDNDNNRNNNNFGNQQQQQQQSLPPPSNDNGDNNNSSKQQQHFNPFAVRTGPELGMDDMAASSPKLGPINPINNLNKNEVDNDGIPDKFNRPGCVVAMRNVPFKADLKDILRFFSDYKLSPDDIIRRFRDDGKPTGDARVAFESPSEARSAFESRRRKLIFNRNVVLEII